MEGVGECTSGGGRGVYEWKGYGSVWVDKEGGRGVYEWRGVGEGTMTEQSTLKQLREKPCVRCTCSCGYSLPLPLISSCSLSDSILQAAAGAGLPL